MIRAGVTPTSNNPVVSVLYGLYNKAKFREGTLLIARGEDLGDVVIRTGLSQLKHDREVALDMIPSEFSKIANEISLESAVNILRKMEINIPDAINNLDDLDKALKNAPDLTSGQISEFMEEISKL